MKFQIQCECGHKWAVTECDAGLRMNCACGRTTELPSLDELRREAGLSPMPLSVAGVIEQRVASGAALANMRCAKCATQTEQVVPLVAECERAYNVFEQTSFHGIVVDERYVGEQGRSVAVPVPIRLCENCQLAVFRGALLHAIPTRLRCQSSVLPAL